MRCIPRQPIKLANELGADLLLIEKISVGCITRLPSRPAPTGILLSCLAFSMPFIDAVRPTPLDPKFFDAIRKP